MPRKGKSGSGGGRSSSGYDPDEDGDHWSHPVFRAAAKTMQEEAEREQQQKRAHANYYGAEIAASYHQPPPTGANSTAANSTAYTNGNPNQGHNPYNGYQNANYAQHPQYAQNNAYQGGHQQQMSYNNPYVGQGYGGTGYGYPPGYNPQQYAQPQQQYQASPPQIRNPFAPPPPAASAYAGVNAAYDPDEQQQIAQWQSAYAPADQQERGKKGGKFDNANLAPLGQRGTASAGVDGGDAKGKGAAADKNVTVVRKGGGQTWEDKSLLEWDPTKFRIMVGNLAGEVTDDLLTKAFANYDVSKARVIRDKRTTKSKGFGFVEFNDSELGFKAAREMNSKYIGSHPVTIKRSTTNVAPVVKKDKNKGRNDKKKDKKDDKGPLHANTQAGIEKKQPSKAPPGLKLLG